MARRRKPAGREGMKPGASAENNRRHQQNLERFEGGFYKGRYVPPRGNGGAPRGRGSSEGLDGVIVTYREIERGN